MYTKNHNHMMYASCDMEYDRHNFLPFWVIFCPFTSLLTTKIKIWNKCKKIPGDIILLHMCPINKGHMMYGSWDIRHSFLSFQAIFYPLTLLTTWKIKVLKKWNKHLKILSFYTCIPQMMIIWCMVPEIWGATNRIFCHFELFFALLPL